MQFLQKSLIIYYCHDMSSSEFHARFAPRPPTHVVAARPSLLLRPCPAGWRACAGCCAVPRRSFCCPPPKTPSEAGPLPFPARGAPRPCLAARVRGVGRAIWRCVRGHCARTRHRRARRAEGGTSCSLGPRPSAGGWSWVCAAWRRAKHAQPRGEWWLKGGKSGPGGKARRSGSRGVVCAWCRGSSLAFCPALTAATRLARRQ